MSTRIGRIFGIGVGAGAVVALAITGISVASATSAGAHGTKSGTEHFFIGDAGSHQSVIAHGLFVGGGTDVEGDSFDTLHLGGGTLRVYHPDSQSHFTDHINKVTCYATITVTGRYSLSGGTGRFATVTGHGTYRASDEAILPRNPKGACSMTVEPFEVGTIVATGPATTK